MESVDQFSAESGIQFLPSGNPVDYLREMGLEFIPFEQEKQLYYCIMTGDVEHFDTMMSHLRESRIIIGPMASGTSRSLQYAEVAFAAIACRSCIEGGMSQAEAFRRCDEITRAVDAAEDVLTIEHWKVYSLQIREMVLRMREIRESSLTRTEIRLACRYVHSNLYGRITVAQMAQASGLSVSHFKALFQQEMGIAPGAYVIRQKIQCACHLLSATNRSLSDIAYTLGFCSQSHFTKTFRCHMGVAPSVYRKKEFSYWNRSADSTGITKPNEASHGQ